MRTRRTFNLMKSKLAATATTSISLMNSINWSRLCGPQSGLINFRNGIFTNGRNAAVSGNALIFCQLPHCVTLVVRNINAKYNFKTNFFISFMFFFYFSLISWLRKLSYLLFRESMYYNKLTLVTVVFPEPVFRRKLI